jgi:hypothetical protein
VVLTGNPWYSSTMDESTNDRAERSNLAAVERRALEVSTEANQIRDDPDLPEHVRQNANAASMASTMAWLMARSGKAASAGAGLAAAEQIHGSVRAAMLRPYAKRGIDFPPGRDTTAATRATVADAAARHSVVIDFVRRILATDDTGKYRHAGGAKAGTPNASKLAEFYVASPLANAQLGVKSVRDILKKAILEKRLA